MMLQDQLKYYRLRHGYSHWMASNHRYEKIFSSANTTLA